MILSTVDAQNVQNETEVVIYYNRLSLLTPAHGKIVFQDDLAIHLDIGEPGIVKIRKELIRKIKENGENVTWEYLSNAEKQRRLNERPTRIILTVLGAGASFILFLWAWTIFNGGPYMGGP
ncbi:MAG: hypothetical protein IIA59_11500 [Candidatus Marinimicrobia bacterium]|nr:hypothetical protein [Candidatus Neomarinimicrobiota bacterium]